MKKTAILLMICLLTALLCACGSGPVPGETPVPTVTPGAAASAGPAPSDAAETPTEAPEAGSGAEPTPDAAPEPSAEPGPADSDLSAEEAKAIALLYVDAPVEDLIARIGEPLSADYAPSCLGEGEDGNLYYDGFIVYTYLENGVETVTYVE